MELIKSKENEINNELVKKHFFVQKTREFAQTSERFEK